MREPVEVDVEEAELPAEVVDGAVLDAEHHAPGHGRHDRRHHGGDGQERGDDGPAAGDPVQEEGDAEAQAAARTTSDGTMSTTVFHTEPRNRSSRRSASV